MCDMLSKGLIDIDLFEKEQERYEGLTDENEIKKSEDTLQILNDRIEAYDFVMTIKKFIEKK